MFLPGPNPPVLDHPQILTSSSVLIDLLMLSHIAFPGTKSYCHGMLFSYFSGFDSLMFYIELFTSTFTVIWSHLGPVLLNVKKNMIWKIMGPHEFDGLFKGCMAESNRIGGHI